MELYNVGAAPLNLAGWIFRDEDDHHAFPLPTLILAPSASLVLCQNVTRFRQFHPTTAPIAGNFQFGLNNAGGTLRLFRPDGSAGLTIVYNDSAPWSTAADGGGSTLELVQPQSDSSLPSSWRASSETGGSPGRL